MFTPSGSHTILVYRYQTAWRYSFDNPPNGDVETRLGRQKSRFWAVTGEVSSAQPPSRKLWQLYRWSYTAAPSPRFYSATATKRALALYTITMDRVYVSKAWRYAEEKRTEKNLIVRSGISEVETTNNKRLRSTFCIEAIQTRSTRGLFATVELPVNDIEWPVMHISIFDAEYVSNGTRQAHI